MLKNYLLIAARNLKISPTYTLLNIAGLALGMAGATLIFFFLNHHLATDRHQPNADRLYRVVLDLHLDEGIVHESGSAFALSSVLGRDYAGVEKAGFVRKIPMVTFSAGSGQATKRFMEKDNVAYADQGYMQLFDFKWLGHNAVKSLQEPFTVILSQKLARKYFGTEDVTGKILRLDNAHDLKITGIIADSEHPSDFQFDAYISLPTLKTIEPSNWISDYGWISSRNYTFVRLASGAHAARIEQLITKNGKTYYGDNAPYFRHHLQPLADIHFNENYDGKIRKSILWILGGVGGFLILVASINFINMATARAVRRAKEIGVRKALGGTRQQLFWQFTCETALVTVLAAWTSNLIIIPLLTPLNNWTHTQAFQFSGLFSLKIAVFALVIWVTIILLAGFYPAVILSGFNPVAALKSKLGPRQVGGIGLRRSLVVVQLAIAQIMIIGAMVMMLQIRFFRKADLGFDHKGVIKITLAKPGQVPVNRQSLRNDLLQYPAVKSVTWEHDAPTSDMGFGGSVRFDNRTEWEKFVIKNRYGDADYIKTYQMPLLAGRSFSDRDSVPEFVVNEEFMKKLGIRDPEKMIGKMMEDGASGFQGRIVGVVKSFHLKSLQEGIEPCVIYARPDQYREVAVRLDMSNFWQTLARIRRTWEAHYPGEVFNWEFADEKIASFYDREEQLTNLIRLFAWVAIVICCLGLYGMVSFMVTEKTKEIGVRKVLGAGVDNILALFGKEFLVLIVVAFAIASPLAWLIMNKWLSHFAYRIDFHWWLIASGGLLILPITAFTIGFRVVKAARMNPVKSLASE
ncbi:ABC transporter permease [Dyadobacter luticola]|uniref:FtsX-like permease family protein n=1 Tax=Dyadobacter luticola TaxID=1979387 RepID=A0A5R9KRJ4_9BACT|nr:FtsX-like permease family protein [Dyadobacter luticola]TLU98892.1 FtsX-like permease family protein [Dyadobacter luticola]